VHQVADIPLDVTAEQSLALLVHRNATYPGVLDLMPTVYPDKTIIDFGCGPGHDTIRFLLTGSAFVLALDVSPKAIAMTQARARAHGVEDRLHAAVVGGPMGLLAADHIHTAGVIHHIPRPVSALKHLRRCLKPDAEIRMMVYSAESDFYQRIAGGDPALFARLADGDAPVTVAWTNEEVVELAAKANLNATYIGSYLHPGELIGPGLSSCWSLTR
jgi:SAM-dependent methyltransferase